MKYTMSRRNDTITLDTETGNITGGTYGMKDIIKNDLYATWNPDLRVWHNDDLQSVIGKYSEYLRRCYGLKSAEVSNQAESGKALDIIDKQLVNGNDGFYMIYTYSDGSHKKVFVG